jgi:hypothetical protein
MRANLLRFGPLHLGALAIVALSCQQPNGTAAATTPTVSVADDEPSCPKCPVCPASPPKQQRARMTNTRLGAALKAAASKMEGESGRWRLEAHGVTMMCITDETHDRMRIVTSVIEESKMTPDQLRAILDANFHSALDARYGVSNGVLFSAFIHPLSSLTDEEVESAVSQVATLAKTFGTTYTSGALTFGR